MLERNICVEAECTAGCCSNVILRGVSKGELNYAFENAEPCSEEDFGKRNSRKGRGVYYANTNYLPDRPFEVQIVRQCPNVGEDFYCELGENRPAPCKNYQIGSKQCTGKRANLSLPPVKQNLVEDAKRIERLRELQAFADSPYD